MRLALVGSALLSSLIVLLPANASAISMQGVGLAAGPTIPGRDPGGFHYITDSDITIHDTARLINTSQQPKKMLFMAVKAQINKDNRVDCAPAADTEESWVTLAREVYDVQPESTIEAPFNITVPTNFKSGEYQACLVAQEQPPDRPHGSMPLNTRVAMRLTVVPRDAQPPNIQLSSMAVRYDDDNVRVSAFLRNTEPITAISQVNLTASPARFKSTRLPATFSKVILPSSGATIDLQPIERPFWGGYYRLRLTVTSKAASSDWAGSKQSVQATREARLLLPPKPPALCVVIGISLGLSGVLVYIRKRFRR